MGELERQRRARDLWISRGHVVAYLTGTVLLALLMFSIGYRVGLGSAEDDQRLAGSSLVSGAPDEDLIEILDRVDAMKDPLGHQQMTFPQLRDPGERGEVLASGPPGPDAKRPVSTVRIELDAPDEQVLPEGIRMVQPSGWGVVWREASDLQDVLTLQQTLLSSANLEAEVGRGHVDERPVFWLVRQGFSSESEARLWVDRQGDTVTSLAIPEPIVREFKP